MIKTRSIRRKSLFPRSLEEAPVCLLRNLRCWLPLGSEQRISRGISDLEQTDTWTKGSAHILSKPQFGDDRIGMGIGILGRLQ
jgi:hypothetical protein